MIYSSIFRSVNRTALLLLHTIIMCSSVFSYPKDRLQQKEDVFIDGIRYMQILFVDDQGKSNGGYLEAYNNPSKGALFASCDPMQVHNKSISQQQFQQFVKYHETSITGMKQRALQATPVVQRQNIDRLYLGEHITAEQAQLQYQQITHDESIAQAHDLAKTIRRQDTKKQKHKNSCTPATQAPAPTKKATAAKPPQISHNIVQDLYEQELSILTQNTGAYDVFTNVMQHHSNALQQSLTTKTSIERFAINPHTANILKAHNIDTKKFQQINGLPIQHELTQELICNLDVIANIADKNFNNQQLQPFIKAGMTTADMAQDYNCANDLPKAISATNCSHGQTHFLQAMMLENLERCEKMLTALKFFNHEVAKYTTALARGVAKGVLSYEITTLATNAISNIATYLAPELTASIYAGATSILAPIAVTAGAICTLSILAELEHLADLSMTDPIAYEKEWKRVKDFAGQFYNFDQAPQAHVENITQLATTFAWPLQREAILNSLMGMHKICCKAYLPSGQIIQRSGTVSTDQLQRGMQVAQSNELAQFKINYKKIFDTTFFDIFLKEEPALVVAGMEQLSHVPEQAALSHFFKNESSSNAEKVVKFVASQVAGPAVAKTEEAVVTHINQKIKDATLKAPEQLAQIIPQAAKQIEKVAELQITKQVEYLAAQKISTDIGTGNIIENGISQIANVAHQVSQEILLMNFAKTEAGKKMIAAITQPYEELMFKKPARIYDKLLEHNVTEECKAQFCLCHEKFIVQEIARKELTAIQATLKNEFPDITMHMRHIFYPTIQPRFSADYKNIIEYTLEGFHHDEFAALEKAGKLRWINKVYGKAGSGAEECFMADIDFDDGIICGSKTFFPSSWSKEETARRIFQASENIIDDLSDPNLKNQKKYLCQGFNNILVEIVFNLNKVITSGYPSKKKI